MNDKEVLIEAENVSKKFARNLKSSLKFGIQDIFREIVGKPKIQRLRNSEFWALKDVSFTVRRGECLALIGHNGAGKSTLLKMLNGLLKPDQGSIRIKGRVAALIELGAGFNPILTGRENIYNNAAVLGFTKEEVNQKINEIIDFSELNEFIDSPVQSYSSGMKVRLGFAVAAQMEPDVLIIDEVLAVGDLGFRIKCLNRIGELLQNSAVIFVSHSMTQVARVCTHGLLLKKGQIEHMDNDIGSVISAYYSAFGNENERIIGGENFKLNHFILKNHLSQQIEKGAIINHSEKIEINVSLDSLIETKEVCVKVFFINSEMRLILDISSELALSSFTAKNNILNLNLITDPLYLNAGNYSLSFIIIEKGTNQRLYRHDNLFELTIASNYVSWGDYVTAGTWS
ncbi:MAG: ABC transporter ATP-binding protein [Bacteroidetes bacterium]|nr:ABC transporter ATP-binding protein [Bacteroidota bacterium]